MKILIIRLTSMGDIIHSMCVLQFIKEALPNISIHWLVDEIFSDILKNNPDIDTIHSISLRKKKGLISRIKEIKIKTKELSNENFDLIIDMQGLLKTAIISYMINGKKAGFDKDSIRESIASLFYDKKITVPYKENIYKRNLKLINDSLCISKKELPLENINKYLFFSEKAKKRASELLSTKGKKIVFIPAASTGERVISISMYRKMIKLLPGKKFLTWGNKAEKETSQNIAENLEDTILLPKIDLDTLKALISACDLVIGPDTGPSNIPFAVKTPSITIYWDKAKNSNKRNTVNNQNNNSFSFSDLNDFDENIIVKKANILLSN
ncbi:MAG: lipopolysaccharide heptosyltransferase I [Candidatus Muiribacterium halophilum]|uniref:Lipopolysaccharide heptosyltransferase 1 n=1 Tax=Muiribacterium halophilum TaxID=2053465 RepID=A0A2N5ZHM1_MUIH1|nr:MAG: lipopolysaccharide heptosyltransferase I [Candidatus Muirbacterium halophilum]